MNARRTEPTRSLTDQRKPHRYVGHEHTDIRLTFKRFRRLQAMQQLAGGKK